MEIKVKVFGYKKEQLELIGRHIIASKNLELYVNEKHLDASLHIINNGEDDRTFNCVTADILQEIRDNVYGEGDVTLGERAIEYLKFHKKQLAVAESLTGGLIANSLIEVSGASEVLYEDLVTYSNESKIKRLGVSRYTIDNYGAVSYECAYEMATGLLKNLDIDIALSTTGIAGPTGGSDIKPVGLTYICIADRYESKVYNHCFEGSRNEIRMQAANTALFYIINKIKNR